MRCHICQRRCRIEDGNLGFCRTRLNRGGRLFTMTYGEVSTWHRSPIEIKPVYHYLPGSYALSLGSVGCNFLCDGCQNHDISFALADKLPAQTMYISPEDCVRLAQEEDCEGISWTYNEPTLWFEYTLDSAKLAKPAGLYTNYVTNGYITMEALELIGPYLDVFRVDIKAFDASVYKKIAHINNWEGILDVVKCAKHHWEMHVELVTNVVPGFNDNLGYMRNLAQWIKTELGSTTPWHITRFFPHWKLKHLKPTPIEVLEKIRGMGLEEGLEFVYIGNVPGHVANHTYCPSCGKILIERLDWEIVGRRITSNKCPFCGEPIPGRFD